MTTDGNIKEYIMQEADQNNRLDLVLTNYLHKSRSFVQQLIKSGLVMVNGKACKANYTVAAGDEVSVTEPEPLLTDVLPEDIPLSILFEDKDMIIIDKARGMVVHPALGNYTGTLVNALLFHCKDLSGINGEIRPGIVHRLDKDTSGVMMAAKTDVAHIELAKQIKEHKAKRKYIALVHGNIVEEKGTIKAPIGRHPKERMKMAVVFTNSKEATTHFTVLERYGKHTLIECALETGRTHQIRVHLAYIGHPVVNDPLYGLKKQSFPIVGQALHSASLHVEHPMTKESLYVEAPLPADLINCIEYAKMHRKEEG